MPSDLSRRKAVQAVTLMPLAAAQGSAANSAVSIGLIGAGNRGTFLAQTVLRHTPGRITAICDYFPEKIAEAKKALPAPDAREFRDYRDMLASNVDAVIIATPVFLHAEHFEAAVKAGKHVYIEKPAAASVADCKRIQRIADAADRKYEIAFGFQRRYGQVYQRAKQAQDSGAIGKVKWANVQFLKGEGAKQRPGNPPTNEVEKIKNWGAWKDLSGDLIVENNIHLIDVMNWFVGARPLKAYGTGGQTVPRYGDCRDNVQVTYEYPDRVKGQLLGTILAPPFFRDVKETFFGEKGVIETSETHWRHYRGKDDVIYEKSPRNITSDSLAAFVDRIATGKPDNTGVRGVESTLTAILGRMAMDLGREVTWEEMMRSEG
ncbi:MAG: Gfo/Idh/MocA family oxidoreductase [Bryobacteraceae bacterium]